MEHAWLLLFVTPAVLMAFAVEAVIARAVGKTVHAAGTTTNNLLVAFGQRAVSATLGLAPFALYPWLESTVGIWDWDTGKVGVWIIAFLVVDFTMYLRHLAAHRVAFLWAIHAVHHQSTDYNLTVATRLGWLQDTILVSLPMAFLGMPMEVVLVLFAAGNTYQLFQHTMLIGRLGIVDAILMTPSNHRVHHGRNPQYLDKNHGNVLVIWDRLFGTWEPEVEPPIYGTLDGLPSLDPLENNLAPIRKLVAKVRRQPTFSMKCAALVRPPEWCASEPAFVAPPQVTRQRPWAIAIAVGGGFAALLVSALLAALPPDIMVAIATATFVLGLVIMGTALDGRWVRPVGDTRQARIGAVIQTLAGASEDGPLAVLGRRLNR